MDFAEEDMESDIIDAKDGGLSLDALTSWYLLDYFLEESIVFFGGNIAFFIGISSWCLNSPKTIYFLFMGSVSSFFCLIKYYIGHYVLEK